MFGYIENLRKKPDIYKYKFALAVSFSITLIILAVWIVFFIMKVNSGVINLGSSDPNNNSNTASVSANDNIPSIKESWSNFVSEINTIIEGDEGEKLP